jgi:TPR repeat protein
MSLGNCYTNGEGVEKDTVEAMKWYRKAAEQNYAEGQFTVGACYAGGHGVEKDYTEAYAWYNLLAATTHPFAEVAKSSRDTLEKKMSPQQVADAQKRTKELRVEIAAKLKSGGK